MLRERYLCRVCRMAGLTVEATELDHIIPVHKDPSRFWDLENLQPICASCHEKKTRVDLQAEGSPEQRAWREYLERQC